MKGDLEAVFKQRGDILKSQLTFKNCGMTFRQFKDGEDFVKNYPFAPYQFQPVQRIFEAIRKAGATGTSQVREAATFDLQLLQRHALVRRQVPNLDSSNCHLVIGSPLSGSRSWTRAQKSRTT